MSRLILVPVDGSPFSEAALPPALRMARRIGARVEIVTVHEPIPTLDYEIWEQQSREWSERYLDDLIARTSSTGGVPMTARVLSGLPADALQAEVERTEADLVVMSSHGRGAFSRLWLGSTSDRFIRQSTVPVILVKPAEAGEEHSDHPFKHLLVPMDGTELSEKVLKCAMDLGHVDGVKYTLVRVFPYPAEFASAYLPHTVQLNAQVFEEGKRAAEDYIEARAEELRGDGHEVDARLLVDASPADGILRAAEEVGADLLAMATHGRGGLNRLMLGSVTDKVLRGSHVPILVFRPQAD
jgi:nucleotide-binding universal stress UspA family protein